MSSFPSPVRYFVYNIHDTYLHFVLSFCSLADDYINDALRVTSSTGYINKQIDYFHKFANNFFVELNLKMALKKSNILSHTKAFRLTLFRVKNQIVVTFSSFGIYLHKKWKRNCFCVDRRGSFSPSGPIDSIFNRQASLIGQPQESRARVSEWPISIYNWVYICPGVVFSIYILTFQ